ncbi:MAG TPA: molecular chaperone DjiA [Hyphomonadaceae bacterium]|nr:molecular chaperone DjiA [Hyphomonadaceae bacterium]
MSLWTQLADAGQRAFADREETGRDVATPLCGPDPGDVEFTAAIVGLGAKLAKADGLVTVDEVAAFSRVFKSAPGDEAAMRRVFDIARQTVHGYESYAKRIAKRYRERPCLLEGVLDGLFQIAGADGAITGEELGYLKSVSDSFGFSEDRFRRIKASHLGPDADDPYIVLGVGHEATFEDVRAAYRRLMRENHPDTVTASKSAPREYEPVAHDKAAAITTAYARIRAERGFLTRAD